MNYWNDPVQGLGDKCKFLNQLFSFQTTAFLKTFPWGENSNKLLKSVCSDKTFCALVETIKAWLILFKIPNLLFKTKMPFNEIKENEQG